MAKGNFMNTKRLALLCVLLLALLIVPVISAQTSATTGEYEGVIQSLDGKWAVISGLKFKVKNAQLDDDIDRLRIGLEVEVDFVVSKGKLKATYIDDDDDDIEGVGELTGIITEKNRKYIVISGLKIVTRNAEIEDDADYRVGGRVDVDFRPKSLTTLKAYNIDDD
jgi:hypothetical protein